MIGTGLSLGVVHVLTGPDHLSALATLSVGSSWKALSLGIRWGLGHSTGLFVVAAIFLAMDGAVDMRKIDQVCNWIVGFAMIALGGYSVYHTYITYAREGHTHLHDQDSELEREIEVEITELKAFTDSSIGTPESDNGYPPEVQLVRDHPLRDPWTQKVVAFSIGIVHGIAGPGGILGVLPAVQLHSWLWSMVYLTSFAFTSTLCMGLFAMVYGECTVRVSDSRKVAMYLSYFSASLSIIVGVIWIILLSLGKLGDIFG